MADTNEMEPTSGAVPYLTIGGGQGVAAVDFYTRAFGATERMRMPAPGGARLMHAHLLINGASVMLSDDFPEITGREPAPPPTGVTVHLQVDDADAWWNRAMGAGAHAALPIHDAFWGARYGQLIDPFGHSWSIGGPPKG